MLFLITNKNQKYFTTAVGACHCQKFYINALATICNRNVGV